MAKEYIELEPGNEYGVISLNKTVFSTIAKNVIEEDENVQIAEGTKPFKTGIVTRVEDNKLTLSIPVKVNHKSNVSDVCLNLQNKIFESISYMTDFKPEAIEIQVTGFIFEGFLFFNFMSVSFENYLVVGISSRALFNLEKENEVFEKEGLDAYRDYQIVHENDVLSPGSGFALVKNLLNINKLANRKLVEVIVMSRNSADTSLRIIHSLEHYDMDIGRMVLSGGEDISRYLSAFGVDLFLSCNENDVSNAIHAGFAAGMIYARFVSPLMRMPYYFRLNRKRSIRNMV